MYTISRIIIDLVIFEAHKRAVVACESFLSNEPYVMDGIFGDIVDIAAVERIGIGGVRGEIKKA